jgi:hypothetical protein
MSLCVRSGCSNPQIPYEEWHRNDGACDACAALRPSAFYSLRSHDREQEIEAADRRWRNARRRAARRAA